MSYQSKSGYYLSGIGTLLWLHVCVVFIKGLVLFIDASVFHISVAKNLSSVTQQMILTF